MNDKRIKTFRDLIAWQKAMDLAEQVYHNTDQMPDSEKYGLTAQMRRATVSIPSNIAEGHGRQSLTEYMRYLRMARGSLMELRTQLLLAERLNFLRIPPRLNSLQEETDRVLQGLIRSLENLPK